MFFPSTQRSYLRFMAELALLALIIFALGALLVRAQDAPARQQPGVTTTSNEEPLLRDYKGVAIGMTAEDARRRLGEPADKGDRQDFYNFSETESAQIFYDATGKVVAISAHYLGEVAAPDSKAVFGAEAERRADGSIYKLVKYTRAGYWVSYNRTAGDQPLITISLKRDVR